MTRGHEIDVVTSRHNKTTYNVLMKCHLLILLVHFVPASWFLHIRIKKIWKHVFIQFNVFTEHFNVIKTNINDMLCAFFIDYTLNLAFIL